MTSWNCVVEKYLVESETTAPMHVGSSFGDPGDVLVHPVTDLPFLQASSLAGVMRAASETLNGEDVTEKLFGARRMGAADTTADVKSRVIVSDAYFDPKTVHMENRPRVALDPATGSVASSRIAGSGKTSGHKFEMELMGTGAKLSFSIYLFHDETDSDREALEAVLAEMAAGHLQVGGQRSNGAGFLKVKRLLHHSFLLKDADGRSAWAGEQDLPASAYEDIRKSLKFGGHFVQAYDIVITGKTEGALLVKGASVADFGAGAPDAENMKNAAEQYIVPGSSLKGALRSRVTWIARRLGKEKLADAMFGFGGAQTKRGGRGNVLVCDTVIGEGAGEVLTKLQHRIHVDRFTGGVMQTGLFAERTVSGDVALHIIVDDRGDAKASAGMILLAVRDLAQGLWNLGSGYNVGRGFITVEKMVILERASGSETTLYFGDGQIRDAEDKIREYLQAVDSWKEQ